jgi:hypothetical protein
MSPHNPQQQAEYEFREIAETARLIRRDALDVCAAAGAAGTYARSVQRASRLTCATSRNLRAESRALMDRREHLPLLARGEARVHASS